MIKTNEELIQMGVRVELDRIECEKQLRKFERNKIAIKAVRDTVIITSFLEAITLSLLIGTGLVKISSFSDWVFIPLLTLNALLGWFEISKM